VVDEQWGRAYAFLWQAVDGSSPGYQRS